jgi:hypothetical protein
LAKADTAFQAHPLVNRLNGLPSRTNDSALGGSGRAAPKEEVRV